MKFLTLALLALPAVFAQDLKTGLLGDAAEIENNPTNVTYEAVFNQENGIKGTFTFTAGKGGEGVAVKVDLKGFESKTGPFKYHIHDQPVPADGNCTGTKAHLDPYQRGQATPCDAEKPETCEVGDLSGKHTQGGNFKTSTYANEYTDDFLSLISPSGAFIGNRSITIHGANATRIACANIVLGVHTASNSTIKPSTPKGDDDEDDSDENSSKGGADSGSDSGSDDDKKEDAAPSAAGAVRAGVVGLSFAVAGVVAILL
jgi:hypothetical protein